jgi:type II secretory pathway component PulK
MRHQSSIRRAKRPGVVLLAVLVVVVLLALAAYQFSDLMTAEGQAAESYRRSIQARAIADSGIHYTAVMLSNRDAFSASPINNNPFNNTEAFYGVAVNPTVNARLQGRFTIFRPFDVDEATASQGYQFGAIDEAGKINLNALLTLDSSGRVAGDLLMGLPNMTNEIADAILDWLDPDDDARTSGAENNSYQLASQRERRQWHSRSRLAAVPNDLQPGKKRRSRRQSTQEH